MYPPLDYRQRQTVEVEQSTSISFLEIDPLNPPENTIDTHGYIRIFATWQEWRVIMSAIQFGLEYLFGDESNQWLALVGNSPYNPPCDEIPCPDACQTVYPDDYTRIAFYPNNPYLTPNWVTDGYLFPAWYVCGVPCQAALGAFANSALTSLERLPIGSLPSILPSSGLPQFQFIVEGSGILRIYLTTVYGGGLAQISINNDLFTLEFVDTNQDIVSIPPETENQVIFERDVETDGAWLVAVVIIPTVQDAIPPVLYGGGLIKVQACGGLSVSQNTPEQTLIKWCYINGELLSDYVELVSLSQFVSFDPMLGYANTQNFANLHSAWAVFENTTDVTQVTITIYSNISNNDSFYTIELLSGNTVLNSTTDVLQSGSTVVVWDVEQEQSDSVRVSWYIPDSNGVGALQCLDVVGVSR